ncbi:protein COFACTOR ASSEMBLY OF COMPLEX C SUBUNIT B CCB2, chloroplastic [Phragmites australis]|uniref:protein COFACTOR ASSEMBLY OF COMPLEX C SUBUNIT B CCB2, chloroplastic n=1 Tax=Phragmites australis TaxID=29695 RepID=UPI002D77E08C|nr:protein COFACTOR ASSEMBLY OF COMPLEX C SUBUNIT B CCB2, chloroplastic [Phragmites australis]XP_062200759.1 protein COFACTOR ASSEMBLY OF COMPLEX C SUBUNIT B CCB2, chloroplastic [Phragmites australis]XP_062200760.1 protein COFACTOR ASSEMBLY OF COMPLEX C SUBUNIT B CCB2, chloroplastic [Phragmites australis]XP_062200761.1 protein COFACTOR ASSEMBLY OF COMPLEX C SUBUNIT B CCB2, chloroplastic [Phragmites australis]
MPLLARAPPLHSHRLPAGLLPHSVLAAKPHRRPPSSRVGASNSEPPQQQVNLSVLRFTLGIPGLDESYLPRWIGLGFGALVILNHVLSPSPTPAQLRSEALGLCLAAFSATLPFLGRFLEGADAAGRVPLPVGSRQVFVMSENLSAAQKEEMAWVSYVLLRNTNTTSVLIAIGDVLCIRGYWDPPADTSKYAMIEWFKSQMQQVGLVDLRDALYFPNFSDTRLGKILPDGVLSVLAQPVLSSPDRANGETKTEGVILLASNANYAYSEKDRVWIRTVANKFQRS